MRQRAASNMAFSGIFAAVAFVVMTLGGLLPVTTFICPVLCSFILSFVQNMCGRRIGWVWYCCVSILALIFGPDKESAVLFMTMGYYPLIKRSVEQLPICWLIKAAFFNSATILTYALLLFVFGWNYIFDDFQALGLIGLAVALLIGNICFYLSDITLSRLSSIFRTSKKTPAA